MGATPCTFWPPAPLPPEDYQKCVPEIEEIIRTCGKVGVLFQIKDFHGWDAAAALEDLKFDVKHHDDVERIALLGDKDRKWDRFLTALGRPFTTAQIRYFAPDHAQEAKHWVGLIPENAAVQH